MTDDVFFEEVAREIKAQAMVPGLWTRAFAEANGSLDQARALYIRYRVAQLASVRKEEVKRQRQAHTKAALQKAENTLTAFLRGCFVFISLVIAIVILVAVAAAILGAFLNAGRLIHSSAHFPLYCEPLLCANLLRSLESISLPDSEMNAGEENCVWRV